MTSRITVTPISAFQIELPITVTVSAETNVFVPPYADGSETFTKQGTDVDITKWTGGAVQGQGIVGDSFITNNMGATVDLSAKIPSYITTKFIGISFWMKIQPNSNPNIIKLLDGANSNANIPIELKNQSGDLWLTTRSDLGSGGSGSITTGVTHVFQGVTSTLTNWTHIFAWVNYNTGVPVLNVSVNGITLTPSTIYPGDVPSTDFNQTPATVFEVGGAGVIKGEISNLHMSSNPLFASELYTYYNQPKEYKLFERPSFTQRELFTQTGTDVSASSWNNTATQIDGVIGKSALVSAADNPLNAVAIDVLQKFPANSIDKFLGGSLFFKSDGVGLVSKNGIFTLTEGPMPGPNSVRLFMKRDGAIQLEVYGPSGYGTNYKVKLSSSTYIDNQWHHIFWYFDLTNATDDITLVIDGTDVGAMTYNTTNFTELGSYSYAWIGRIRQQYGTYAFRGSLNNFYWSTNPDFKNHLNKYSNLPSVEVT